MPGSSHSSLLSALGESGVRHIPGPLTKRPAQAWLLLVIQDSAQMHFLRKSFNDNSIYKNHCPHHFLLYVIVHFLLSTHPLMELPHLLMCLPAYCQFLKREWNSRDPACLALCAASPVPSSVTYIQSTDLTLEGTATYLTLQRWHRYLKLSSGRNWQRRYTLKESKF